MIFQIHLPGTTLIRNPNRYSLCMSTCFDLLGLSAPIVQAPMAGVQNHRLAAAVCNAGGLGALPAAMLSASDLQVQLQALSQSTDIFG